MRHKEACGRGVGRGREEGAEGKKCVQACVCTAWSYILIRLENTQKIHDIYCLYIERQICRFLAGYSKLNKLNYV